MDPLTVVPPPELSNKAKQEALRDKLAQEIEDLTYCDTHAAAVAKWGFQNTYLFVLEHGY